VQLGLETATYFMIIFLVLEVFDVASLRLDKILTLPILDE